MAATMAGCGPPWKGGAHAMIALDAGDFRGHHAHVRRRDHGIFAAGDVAADRVHGNVLVTENDAGQGLDFEVLDALALLLREVADLRLREADVLDVLGLRLSPSPLQSRPETGESFRATICRISPTVREAPRRRASRPRKYAFDRGAHFGVVGGHFFGVAARASGVWPFSWSLVREGRPERPKRARDD